MGATHNNSHNGVKMDNGRDRVLERATVEGRVYIHDESRLFIAPLLNISGSGIFIEGLTSLSHGAQVRLVIKSEELGVVIQAKGQIVRIENESRVGTAVHFGEIAPKFKSQIQNSVKTVNATSRKTVARNEKGKGRQLKNAS